MSSLFGIASDALCNESEVHAAARTAPLQSWTSMSFHQVMFLGAVSVIVR